MATLPARAECIECGNLTRFTRDDGMPTCRDCMDIINAARETQKVTYPVRKCISCNREAEKNQYCWYHERQGCTHCLDGIPHKDCI